MWPILSPKTYEGRTNMHPDFVLEYLQYELAGYNLSNVRGSAFDNAFNVFTHPEENNLVVLGTNGDVTDQENTTLEWLNIRHDDPSFSNVERGVYNGPNLQGRLQALPLNLNECFGNEVFHFENTIYSNCILMATAQVEQINNQFANNDELIANSIRFVRDALLYNLSIPRAILAYGNANEGYSALTSLQQIFPNLLDPQVVMHLYGTYYYKAWTVECNGAQVPLITIPHLSYAPVNINLLAQVLNQL
jgi:hypothetical protein